MVCRTAWLLRVPEVSEVTEHGCHTYNPESKKWDRYYQPLLIPEYTVSFLYDYGACCGVDSHEESFATREAAQAAIDNILSGNGGWLKYDEDFLEGDSS